MPDTKSSESNDENKNNQELEAEVSSDLSVKSLNESDSSIIIFNKCHSDNTNASMINQLNFTQSSSSDSILNEKKISSILRENVKLKEMFRHKDNSTRKKLKAIICLDKEIRQICENYKQHFLEATEVIDLLREENSRLKAQSTLNLSAEDKNETENAPMARELNLIGQLRDLARQLKDSQDNYMRSQLELKEIENKFKIEEGNFHETIRKFQEELKNMKQKILSLTPSDLLLSMNEHWKNELETKYLMELTAIFKQILDKKILEDTENGESNNKEKLHKLFKCFTEHCANSLEVENFPDECNNVVKAFKNVEVSFNEDIVDDIKLQNNKFLNCKNALIDDQLQSIKDERIFRNIQIEFLKVYSDYSNISNKMEFLKSQHLKKDKKHTDSDINAPNLAEIEKCLMEEKKLIDSTRIKLDEERLKIEEDKQYMREERELFDAERISLLEEKELIIEENKDIINENLYLNCEITKLKEELASRRDSISLKEELESITAKFNDIKEKLKISIQTNSELSEEISKMMNKDEEIWAYKMQVEMQQAEFHEMHQAEQNYLVQIENLSMDIRELREENARLRQRNGAQVQEFLE